jgi:hypothetical protein
MAHISQVAAMCKAVAANIPLEFRYTSGSYIDLARNELVSRTLSESPDVTHVLFIDQDMVLPADCITQLLAHDKEVVGVTYFTKDAPYYPVALVWDENDNSHFLDSWTDDLTPVGSIGMGCTLIQTAVLRDMREQYAAKDGDRPGWFVINGERRPMGEDTHFGFRCHNMGITHYLDTTLLAGHEGSEVVTHQHYEQWRKIERAKNGSTVLT